jgi:signal transduction histidine kinase
MAQQFAEPESQTSQWIERSIVAADRCTKYTERLLSFARRRSTASTPIDTNRVLEGAESEISELLGEQITLQMDLQKDARPVLLAPDDFKEALFQLSANARDAMPEGGNFTIRTRNISSNAMGMDLAGDFLLLESSDSGEGMTPEVKARCLEPFYTTRKVPGVLGLGLSTVYGFVQRSNGSLEIESSPGQGTTVRIFLPHCTSETT